MATQPNVKSIDATAFTNFCPVNWSKEAIDVPIITHVIERQPIIQQRVSQRVEYVSVPVQHKFEQVDYEVQVLEADCGIAKAAPVSNPAAFC